MTSFMDGLLVKLLLTSGALVDPQTDTKKTPLHLAAIWGLHEVVKLLIEYKANLESIDIVFQFDYILDPDWHLNKEFISRIARGLSIVIMSIQFLQWLLI